MTTTVVEEGRAFHSNAARSKSFVVGFVVAILVESIGLHLLIYRRWPVASVVLLLLNAWTVWYLVQDYRSLQRLPLVVRSADVLVRMGTRFGAVVPNDAIEDAFRPTWQQVPERNTAGYLALATDPNVMLRFRSPVTFAGPLGLKRQASMVGLQLDEADAFVRMIRERLTPSSTKSSPA